MFVIARFLLGFGIPFAIVAASSMIGELSYPKERARIGSLIELARTRRENEERLRAYVQALEQQRLDLQTADLQKNQFLAMLSHELRNPLAPIRNAGEVLATALAANPQAAGLLATSSRGGAHAAPIQAPDLRSCHPPDLPDTAPGVDCCLAYRPGTGIVDFEPPPASSPLRVRPAAHLVDEAYVAKYERAVGLMKELPDDDPRSFVQQARVHCAYCNGAYDQVGFPDLDVQVHNCWLFFPWHR